MDFCTDDEYRRFLHQAPDLRTDARRRRHPASQVLVQRQPSTSRSVASSRGSHDPLRRWKLSPMDVESIKRWEDYSRAKDEMFVSHRYPRGPWYVVEADDKRRARINMIAHLLTTLDYTDVEHPAVELPRRPAAEGYERPSRDHFSYVPDHAATLH